LIAAWFADGRRFGLTVLTAVGVGWLAAPPAPDVPAVVQVRSDAWALPALPRPSDQVTLAAQLAGAPMWGPDELKKAAEAPPEDLRWRLAGLYGKGRQGGVLVLFEDPQKLPQRLKVGDKLPDGQVIEAIEGNQVAVRDKKKRSLIGVESRE